MNYIILVKWFLVIRMVMHTIMCQQTI